MSKTSVFVAVSANEARQKLTKKVSLGTDDIGDCPYSYWYPVGILITSVAVTHKGVICQSCPVLIHYADQQSCNNKFAIFALGTNLAPW